MLMTRTMMAKPRSTINYKTNVTFNDIFGMDEIKAQFKETINYFKSDKSKYRAIGARLKKGILLYGPSGTGKTLMAKAVAGECNVNFIYQSASEFMDKYIGVGSSRVRDLFKKARELQPCIIFIDEIDALGSRVLDKGLVDHAASIEKNNTINQLLTELDGFKDLKDIFVIAATNNIDAIDTSLLRAGRFDRKIGTRIPDRSEREGIFAKKLEKMKHEVTADGIKSAAMVADFTGADIDAIVNEAAFISLRKELSTINDESLLESARYFANK
jgi:cell division protease FtsH